MSELKEFISTFATPDLFTFERGFSEPDLPWKPEPRETDEETQARLRLLLDDIFEHDNGKFISLTSHSGAVRAILAVINHPGFRLAQGSVMAVLVKAERIKGDDDNIARHKAHEL
jgi:broad specificity phosphatase PhoE